MESNPWPQKLVDEVRRIVSTTGEFDCDPSGATRVEWARQLDALNDSRVSLPMALSISRHSQRHRREKQRLYLEKHPEIVSKAAERYRTGDVGILELSRELDAPPIALFKLIMETLGRTGDPWTLSARDQQQRADARAHDCTSKPAGDLLHEEALRFEDRVAHWLHRAGVKFQRESEQREKGNRNTPDFLLNREQKISGLTTTPVKWVEVKSYFGVEESLDEIREQIARYVRVYGPGVVVFRFGYEPSISLGKKVRIASMD